ncbi:MAG: hypothetical protein GWM98_21535, partial [Nitrospinaceae bacterium]|nr:hypothetical protein [Nitrospinaceae bacterium]NIR56567.1 hypothetical protein [Nitrospinaceae bacterium]NIS87029.1 hypothetical protein [Nitrospinaceae bacterium]NIT83873.1 hypothetical protein [Nitrospinaceae bacterium]NIU46076.1 hypothetical protein [Nitrospinaceae bacterium]
MKNKLIRVMLLVGALPLMLAMVLSYIQGTKSLENVIGSSFKALAYETATKIDFIMKEEINRNTRLAKHPTIILAAKGHNRIIQDLPPEEAEKQLLKEAELWAAQDPGMNPLTENAGSRVLKSFLKVETPSNQATRALYITDAQGTLLSSINHYPDYRNAGQDPWEKTIQGGKDYVYVGKIHQSPVDGEYVFQVAIPIRNHQGRTFGVFHRVYAAKAFFASFIEPIIFGDTG